MAVYFFSSKRKMSTWDNSENVKFVDFTNNLLGQVQSVEP